MRTKDISKVKCGEIVKIYRAFQGLTLDQLSKATGYSAVHIGKIERGDIRNPTVTTMRAIAKALGVTTSHLLGEVHFLAEWPKGEDGC